MSVRVSAILTDTAVVDYSFPVHAESKIVAVAFRIAVAVQVERYVFSLFFNGTHTGGHLHGQQGRGFSFAGNNIQQGLVLCVEAD